ncbi:hypothetical protein [Streptomyces bottropensis]|uniref:hypothetical protein n=1 Tax=Streptomyces bottropensis TaxID=42235 RepID=UPI0036908AD5
MAPKHFPQLLQDDNGAASAEEDSQDAEDDSGDADATDASADQVDDAADEADDTEDAKDDGGDTEDAATNAAPLRGPCRKIVLWHGGDVCDPVFCGV